MIDPTAYAERGFAVVAGLFDPTEVDVIRREAQRVFALQLTALGIIKDDDVPEAVIQSGMFELFSRDLQRFVDCGKQAQHLISLHRLALDPRIVDTLAALGIEFPNVATRPLLYFNHPKLAKKEVYWRLSAHQDWRSMQGSLDACVVWVPLTDIDRDLGALEVAPGSHLDGLRGAAFGDGYGRISDEALEDSMEAIELKRGDALLFSALLVHRSGTNVTDSIRWSCHFRYNNLCEPTFVDRGFPHPYVYRPQEDLITPGFPSPKQVRDAVLRSRTK